MAPDMDEDTAAITAAAASTIAYNVCAWVTYGLRPAAILLTLAADAALCITGRFYVSAAWEQEPGPP